MKTVILNQVMQAFYLCSNFHEIKKSVPFWLLGKNPSNTADESKINLHSHRNYWELPIVNPTTTKKIVILGNKESTQ